MPIGGTHVIYIASIVVLLNVLPKTWAAHHPDSDLAKAILYIFG